MTINLDTPHLPDQSQQQWPTLGTLRIDYLRRVLAHTNGNKTKAAELLGIDRRTVGRILARLR